ncbi:uncharacterized protein LOC133194457 [Saccostrea echinata]|uniref:uncharacterized protein LOC133194457 n=1 Tax=Saccostrea echinata TaxID=191078 RepID=UPI002A820065|nr:uncharacterized protein LOC133194457 [Saccostrea echinata]
MKGIYAFIVICCILNLHLIQGYYTTGVIRDKCLENELSTTNIYIASTRIIYHVCIPSPLNEKRGSLDITVRGWRCPGDSFSFGAVAGRMRCCTKEGLEVKSCIFDSNIYNFDNDFVSSPPKGFHLKGRFGLGNPNDPFGYRLEYCSLQRRRDQY